MIHCMAAAWMDPVCAGAALLWAGRTEGSPAEGSTPHRSAGILPARLGSKSKFAAGTAALLARPNAVIPSAGVLAVRLIGSDGPGGAKRWRAPVRSYRCIMAAARWWAAHTGGPHEEDFVSIDSSVVSRSVVAVLAGISKLRTARWWWRACRWWRPFWWRRSFRRWWSFRWRRAFWRCSAGVDAGGVICGSIRWWHACGVGSESRHAERVFRRVCSKPFCCSSAIRDRDAGLWRQQNRFTKPAICSP